tara:strand:- start:4337 stop:4930 length:594 start_codon:yes stop_codon:yes gene_type:complete
MTSIVAISTEEGVYLGGDLAGSNGHNIGEVSQSKVFGVGEFLVGYCGSFRAGQIVEHAWRPPARSEGVCDYNYLVLEVIPSLMVILEGNGFGGHDGTEVKGGNFVLVYGGRVYEVQSDYSILEWAQPVVCLGSGGDVTESICTGMLIVNERLTKNKKLKGPEIIATALLLTSYKIASVSGIGPVLFQKALEDLEEEE